MPRSTYASQVAYGGTLDGAVISGNLCSGCHTSGAGGALTPAPKPESHRVVSEEAANQVVEMMAQRTLYNDAQIGIPGYNSGAKTGSARLAARLSWLRSTAK